MSYFKSVWLFASIAVISFAAVVETSAACKGSGGIAQVLKLKKQPPPSPAPVPLPESPPVIADKLPNKSTASGPDDEVMTGRHPLLKGRDGKDGPPGKDGLPGVQGLPGPAADLTPVAEAIARLEKRLESLDASVREIKSAPGLTNGKDGAPGKDGSPGRDGAAINLDLLVAALAKLEARLEAGKSSGVILNPAGVDYGKLAEEVTKRLPPQPAYFEIVPLKK